MAVGLFSFFSACTSAPVETAPNLKPQMQPPQKQEVFWKLNAKTILLPDGSVDQTTEYQYDENGNLASMVEKNTFGAVTLKTDYKWEGNKMVSSITSRAKKPSFQVNYTTDSSGRIIKESKMDDKGNIFSTVRYEYDGDKISSETIYGASGIKLFFSRYNYEDSLLTSIDHEDQNGILSARVEFTAANGLVVKERTVLPDGSIESGKDIQYKGERVHSEAYLHKGEVFKSVQFDYDNHGNIIRETWWNNSGKVIEIIEMDWVQWDNGD